MASNGRLGPEAFFEGRGRNDPPPEEEMEIADMNDEEDDDEVVDIVQHVGNHMSYLQQALKSAVKHNDVNDYFGEKPMKWVTRAEAFMTKDPNMIQEQIDFYENKVISNISPGRRQRAAARARFWHDVAFFPRDEHMHELIRTTGERYDSEVRRLSIELDAMYRSNYSGDQLHELELEFQTASRSLEQWSHANAYQALINVKIELHNFQRACQEFYDARGGPRNDDKMKECAANVLAWKMKARQLAIAEGSQ